VSDVGPFRRGTSPFDFTAGVPRPGRYPPDGLDVPEAIEAIRFAPVEVGYGFDAAGRQIFRQVGDADGISGFERRDLTALTNGTLVHSHPPYQEFPEGDPRRRAGSFSPLDLVFMYETELLEVIAVTRERTYFLRRRREGLFLDPGQIQADYARYRRRVERQLMVMLARGIISREEAEAQGRLADEIMDRFSDAFEYRWEEVRLDDDQPK